MKSRTFLTLTLLLPLAGGTLLWAGPEGDQPAAEVENQLRALRDKRVETAARCVESSQEAYLSGTLVISELLLARQHLLDAQLAVTRSDAGRLRAFEDNFSKLKELHNKAELSHEHGTSTVALRSIAYARETAEISMLEEKLRGLKAR